MGAQRRRATSWWPSQSTTRRMRSLTCRPSSRRTWLTSRTTSRARPSASSSGVTTVSRATTPAPPGSGRGRGPLLRYEPELELVGLERAARDDRRRRRDRGSQSPSFTAAQQLLHVGADPRAEHAGDEHELRLGRGRDVGRELDPLDVDLVA